MPIISVIDNSGESDSLSRKGIQKRFIALEDKNNVATKKIYYEEQHGTEHSESRKHQMYVRK